MVSQIESGRLTPSLHTLGKIAAALGVPIASLFDGAARRARSRSRARRTIPSCRSTARSERWAVLGRRALPGQDPRRGVDARTALAGRDHRQGRHQARPDEALLRARRARWRSTTTASGTRLETGRQRAPRRRHRRTAGRTSATRRPGRSGSSWVSEPRARWQDDCGERRDRVDFRTDPSRYRHWKLTFDGPVATLAMDVQRGRRAAPGLRAEAELLRPRRGHRAVRRGPAPALRASRKSARSILTVGQGARLLRGRQHPHAGPVDPRLEGELLQVHQRDAQRHRGGLARSRARPTSPRSTARARAAATSWRWPASEIVMADDGNTSVSLPEVPLLAVLPGTGGLTRLVDKRHVRRDRADFFCTLEEGMQGQAGGGVGAGRRGGAALAGSTETVRGARDGAGRAHRPAGGRAGHRARAARAHDRRRPRSRTRT